MKRITPQTCGSAKDAHRKLTEDFLADLDRSWRQRGHEILDRIRAEYPIVYFKTLIQLTVVLHRRLPEPPAFDRRSIRADALQRLQDIGQPRVSDSPARSIVAL
jgi:hypothetical protein